ESRRALQCIFYRLGGGRRLLVEAHRPQQATTLRRPPLPRRRTRREEGGACRGRRTRLAPRRDQSRLRLTSRPRKHSLTLLGRFRRRRPRRRAGDGPLRGTPGPPGRAACGPWPGRRGSRAKDLVGLLVPDPPGCPTRRRPPREPGVSSRV
ncbi:MAG: hypothetical protein AVDCRST_MAG80-531, partial [uncultured Rubrobacteraceae bacterium]